MRTDREFSQHAYISEFPGQSLVSRYQASDDPDTGTAQTVDRMRAAAEKDCVSEPVMRATSMALLFGDASEAGRVRAIHDWISTQIKFRQDDPVCSMILGFDEELDMLIHPARLLTMQRPSGDCDDFTMLTCAMLLCADIPCEIVTIKADPRDPNRYSHVYAQAITLEGIIPMDCSQSAQHGYPVGWQPEAGVTERTPWGIMQPPQMGTGLHGYVGLGQSGEVDVEGTDLGGGGGTSDNSSGELTIPSTTTTNTGFTCAPGNIVLDAAGNCGPPTVTTTSPGSGLNLTTLGVALGADAARIAQLATLPAGYTLNAAGQPVLAGTAAISTGIASLFSNPIIWLLIGAAILIPEMEGGGRR
jgi:Transglutaminase-like superfamily